MVGMYTPGYTPWYTTLGTPPTAHPATVQAPRHREAPLTALAYRVAELTVSDIPLTVTRFTVGYPSHRHPFHCLARILTPWGYPLWLRQLCAERSPSVHPIVEESGKNGRALSARFDQNVLIRRVYALVLTRVDIPHRVDIPGWEVVIPGLGYSGLLPVLKGFRVIS